MAADSPSVRSIDPEWGIVAPKKQDGSGVESINGMPVSADLRKQYRGMPELLFWRSVHSEQCRKPFDALVLCTRGLLEPKICAEVAAAYNPCAKEMKRKELMIAKQKEEHKARELTAKSRE